MKKSENIRNTAEKLRENSGIKRRDFFKILGGGILIFFYPWKELDLLALPAEQARRSPPKDFNAFLHIAEDGSVSCYTGKIEMGQGNMTALWQMIADELRVPFEKVKMVMGDTDLCPWDAGTNGSTSIRSYGVLLRNAAAEARMVLLQMGSEKLGVPVTQVEAINGFVRDTMNNKKSVSYAELTQGKKIEKHIDIKPVLINQSKFEYISKPYLRKDAMQKVTGEAKYAGDLKLPGMVHARILRPPSHGAKLVSVDVSGAEKIEGIKVIRDGDLIAVLHENRDKADEAIVKVKAQYSFNETPVNDKTIFDWMLKADSKTNVLSPKGDIAAGKESSAKVIESEYYNSYVAHAPIEPHVALARLEGDKMTIWASSQNPFPLQDEVARTLEFPIEKVRIIVPFVGGGFGGKNANQQGVEAARLAKLSGRPVMLSWTREEEFFYDTFRPAGLVKITSGMDNTGKIVLWDFHTYYNYTRGSDTIYDVPNNRITSYNKNVGGAPVHYLSTGAWRAPGVNTHTHARESQIDIMASKAGIDPLEFRLKNLKDEKMIGVLKAVADKFGYIPGKTPSGRGIGIAVGIDVNTWVAHIAEVKVDKKTGHVQVVRVVCAQDMGLCINPEGTLQQMEGCITMGLGYSLTEEIKFEGGDIQSKNFDSYEIPRFSWIPKIETVILDKKDQPAAGCGEPAIICMGAVIANAIFDATGARLYQLPMTPARVLEALKKV